MYIIIKAVLAIAIIVCSTRIGILLSRKYKYRLETLDEFKNEFKIIENKIKYTYQPLEEIFYEIADISSYDVKTFFKDVADNIKAKGAEIAWKEGLEKTDLNIKKEDKQTLREFGTLLGKINKEGQLNQINFTNELLDRQIEKAKREREKNESMYQKLGVIFGIGLVIVLI